MMQSRRTLLDALPLLTVIGLCALLVLTVRGRIDPTLAQAPSAPNADGAELDPLSAAVQPPTTPWGLRTAGELLEQVFDPPAEGESVVFPKPPREASNPDAPPAADEPFQLKSGTGVVLAEG